MFDYKNIPDGPEDDEMEQYLKRFLGEKEDIVNNKGVMYALEQLEYIAEKEVMTEYCKADMEEVSNFIIYHLDYNDASRMDLILTIIIQMSLVDVWNAIINEQNIADRKVSDLIRKTAKEILEYKYAEFMDKCYKRTAETANTAEENVDKQNNKIDQKKINELVKENAKSGILKLKIILAVVLLCDIMSIIGNVTVAIISFSIFAGLCGLFILCFKKVYNDPEKYQHFFDLNTTRVSNARSSADIRDKEDYKYDKEYGFVSSLFNRKISVSAVNVSKEYIERCIDFFQTLNEEEIRVLMEGALQFCNEFRVLCDFEKSNIDIPESITGEEILEYIYPCVMYIGTEEMVGGDVDMYVGGEEKGDPEKIEFIVECDCDWEQEHGLWIIVIDDKIVSVGSYDGDIESYRHGNNN